MSHFSLLLFVAASVVFVEAVTELLCKSKVFIDIRTHLSKRSEYLKEMLGCGYCTSVWIATLPSIYITVTSPVHFIYKPLLFLFYTVVFHRLSNFVHNTNDKHLDKYYDKRLSS